MLTSFRLFSWEDKKKNWIQIACLWHLRSEAANVGPDLRYQSLRKKTFYNVQWKAYTWFNLTRNNLRGRRASHEVGNSSFLAKDCIVWIHFLHALCTPSCNAYFFSVFHNYMIWSYFFYLSPYTVSYLMSASSYLVSPGWWSASVFRQVWKFIKGAKTFFSPHISHFHQVTKETEALGKNVLFRWFVSSLKKIQPANTLPDGFSSSSLGRVGRADSYLVKSAEFFISR